MASSTNAGLSRREAWPVVISRMGPPVEDECQDDEVGRVELPK